MNALKPLKWCISYNGVDNTRCYRAKCLHGYYEVRKMPRGWCWRGKRAGVYVWFGVTPFKTKKAAQVAAQAHWQRTMRPFLRATA